MILDAIWWCLCPMLVPIDFVCWGVADDDCSWCLILSCFCVGDDLSCHSFQSTLVWYTEFLGSWSCFGVSIFFCIFCAICKIQLSVLTIHLQGWIFKKKTQSFRPIATLPRTLNFTSKFARYGPRSGIHGGSVVRAYLVKAPQCHISLCIVCAIIYWKFRMLIPINMTLITDIYSIKKWNVTNSYTNHHINFVMDHMFFKTHIDKQYASGSNQNNNKQPPMAEATTESIHPGIFAGAFFDCFWLGHVGSMVFNGTW